MILSDGQTSQDVRDHLVARQPLALRLKAQDDSVPQYRIGHDMQVFFGDVVPSLQEGSGLGREDETNGGSGAGPVLDPFPLARGLNKIDNRFFQFIGDWYVATQLVLV